MSNNPMGERWWYDRSARQIRDENRLVIAAVPRHEEGERPAAWPRLLDSCRTFEEAAGSARGLDGDCCTIVVTRKAIDDLRAAIAAARGGVDE